MERKRNLKLGESGKVSLRIYKLGELGEVSFVMLKLGELGEVSFRIYNSCELGEVSFGMLKLGELGEVSSGIYKSGVEILLWILIFGYFLTLLICYFLFCTLFQTCLFTLYDQIRTQ